MAGEREINKTNYLNIRISDSDLKDLQYLCKHRELSKTEMVVYLIRREADKIRDLDNLNLKSSY